LLVNLPAIDAGEIRRYLVTQTITLPSHWAAALINADFSGYSEAEVIAIDAAFTAEWVVQIFALVDGSERFTRFYRLYHGDADSGEVADYLVYTQE
jgi:hypothetical protein